MDDNLKNNLNSRRQELFEFIEKMVDKRIVSEEEASHDEAKVRNRNFLVAVVSIGLTFFVGASGIVMTGISENHDRDHQTLLEAKRRKLEVISSVSNAMTNMRELRDCILLECDPAPSPEKRLEFEKERLKTSYQLVKEARGAVAFFSDKFWQLGRDYIKWHDSIRDYCSPDAPSEDVWLEKQKAIEEEMKHTDIELFF